ncbi:hypothetical protein C8F04DRAFT_1350068 [Mycena alexandri]|uniref:Uncharacterized protein n=1 Tax=Mycena alexandri TaxID=1745969 RepID=A0AAD6SXN1_9AGAR|nr:hypothetical protein C8F04DRAFT_1350068 [Mycena alexandri]
MAEEFCVVPRFVERARETELRAQAERAAALAAVMSPSPSPDRSLTVDVGVPTSPEPLNRCRSGSDNGMAEFRKLESTLAFEATVESLKRASSLTDQTANSTAPKSVKSYANTASKPIPPPIPNPSDEHILVRFDGEVPPLFHQPYHEILAKLNAHLASLDLPGLVYTQKQSGSSIFIVPKTKDDVKLLSQQWSAWAPGIFPGGRIAPVAEHCYLQVNGIPFRAVDSLDSTAREFEERNLALGKVLSVTWVNRPPSVEKVAAIAARGLKPPTAGSLFIRLQSRDSVDRAVAAGRVVLSGMAPMVQPRKRIAAQLNQRAADICRALDEASIHNKQRAVAESGSPLSTTSTLFEDPGSCDATPLPALRLHERL